MATAALWSSPRICGQRSRVPSPDAIGRVEELIHTTTRDTSANKRAVTSQGYHLPNFRCESHVTRAAGNNALKVTDHLSETSAHAPQRPMVTYTGMLPVDPGSHGPLHLVWYTFRFFHKAFLSLKRRENQKVTRETAEPLENHCVPPGAHGPLFKNRCSIG
ncbi:hypothetical protein TNCV_4684981 [Trichonephila clavipes]|nr:hypothetical protein TNCV_4684981 [Trichonephila clavipes]